MMRPDAMTKVARRPGVSGRGFARLPLFRVGHLRDRSLDRRRGIRVDRFEPSAHLGRGGLEQLEKTLVRNIAATADREGELAVAPRVLDHAFISGEREARTGIAGRAS